MWEVLIKICQICQVIDFFYTYIKYLQACLFSFLEREFEPLYVSLFYCSRVLHIFVHYLIVLFDWTIIVFLSTVLTLQFYVTIAVTCSTLAEKAIVMSPEVILNAEFCY